MQHSHNGHKMARVAHIKSVPRDLHTNVSFKSEQQMSIPLCTVVLTNAVRWMRAQHGSVRLQRHHPEYHEPHDLRAVPRPLEEARTQLCAALHG